jgi:hypothetical protein
MQHKMRYENSFSVSLKTTKPLSPKAINRFQYKACLFAEFSNHQPRR